MTELSIPLSDSFVSHLLDRYPFFAREVGVWGGRFHLSTPYPVIGLTLFIISLIVGIVLPPDSRYILIIPLLWLFRFVYFLRFRAYWKDGRLLEWLFLPVWAPSLLAQILVPWRQIERALIFFFVVNWLAEFIMGFAQMFGAYWMSYFYHGVTCFIMIGAVYRFFNSFNWLGYWSALGKPGRSWQAMFMGARKPSNLVRFALHQILFLFCIMLILGCMLFVFIMMGNSATQNELGVYGPFALIGACLLYVIVRMTGWLRKHLVMEEEHEQEIWSALLTG